MKKQLTTEEIMDYWLEKGHGISIKWLIDNEPELIKSPEWYKKYAVSQELHDEWYEWATAKIAKHYKWSQKFAKRQFAIEYLNCSPSVIKE